MAELLESIREDEGSGSEDGVGELPPDASSKPRKPSKGKKRRDKALIRAPSRPGGNGGGLSLLVPPMSTAGSDDEDSDDEEKREEERQELFDEMMAPVVKVRQRFGWASCTDVAGFWWWLLDWGTSTLACGCCQEVQYMATHTVTAIPLRRI